MAEQIVFPIRAFKDNYIWIFFDKVSLEAWVVDPGDAAPVTQFLAEHHLRLVGILVTHHHADHSGGIEELLNKWPGVSVVASKNSRLPFVSHPVREHDEIACSLFYLKVLEIPGHTLDHIAFYNENMLFCGDTLFSAGCGRVFEGTYPQMYHSLHKLLLLSDRTNVFCGHEYTRQNLLFALQVEPNNTFIMNKLREVEEQLLEQQPSLPSLLLDERKMNPFLRCSHPDVIAAVEAHAEKKLKSPEEVFQYLREWKNRFV